MRKQVIIIVSIVIALILGRMLLSYVDKAKSTNARKSMSTPSVTVAEVETRNLIRQFEAPARVVAKYRVDVLARISGYLTKSYFKEGDYVKAGQVLFEIEPQEYQYAANKAKANLDNAKAQSDYYKKQLARYEELVKQDYIAKSEYDNIKAQYDAYNAQEESAESVYRDAKRNLSYTQVKAPVNGRVGIIDVTVGNFVSTLSGPLTTINSADPMYVTFPLEAKDYAELVRIDKDAAAKRNVDFYFSNGQKYEIQGIQDFYDNKIDETTGTITLRATFANPKDMLIQGDFGRIKIFSKSEDNVVVVPQSATMENQEGRYAFIIDDKGLPRITYLETSGQTEDGMWIISKGINIGDKIITSGLQKIVPGMPIRIVENATEVVKPQKKENILTNFINKFKK